MFFIGATGLIHPVRGCGDLSHRCHRLESGRQVMDTVVWNFAPWGHFLFYFLSRVFRPWFVENATGVKLTAGKPYRPEGRSRRGAFSPDITVLTRHVSAPPPCDDCDGIVSRAIYTRSSKLLSGATRSGVFHTGTKDHASRSGVSFVSDKGGSSIIRGSDCCFCWSRCSAERGGSPESHGKSYERPRCGDKRPFLVLECLASERGGC